MKFPFSSFSKIQGRLLQNYQAYLCIPPWMITLQPNWPPCILVFCWKVDLQKNYVAISKLLSIVMFNCIINRQTILLTVCRYNDNKDSSNIGLQLLNIIAVVNIMTFIFLVSYLFSIIYRPRLFFITCYNGSLSCVVYVISKRRILAFSAVLCQFILRILFTSWPTTLSSTVVV